MADPQAFQVTIRVVAFGTTAEELRDRVEATIRTHPTLSFRVDTIAVSAETPPNFDDAMFKNITPLDGREVP